MRTVENEEKGSTDSTTYGDLVDAINFTDTPAAQGAITRMAALGVSEGDCKDFL